MKSRHIVSIAVLGALLFFGIGWSQHFSGPLLSEPTAKATAATPVAKSVTNEATTEPASAMAVSNHVEAAAPAMPAANPAPQAFNPADVDPHKAFGSKSAPIVMEVFSDFQCPACKQLYKTTNQPLLDNYVHTSKVYLVHRDFPLPMHAYSRVAARYVRAAAQLGRAEQAEQALFQNQEKWEQTGDIDGTLAAVLSPADMTKIRAQAKGTALDTVIDKDVALGKIYNVNQTPTTIIHYKGQTYPVVGVLSYDLLHQFLDQLLAQ
ncbi:MAG TPA: thioredoxin domain-containing protein [Dongiaceae bacterium]|nr:thioredoxin domain-containing protein [Dongiaceae bacterium]